MWTQLGAGRDATAIEHLMPAFTGEVDADLRAAWQALAAAGPALRAAGQLPQRATGVVAQLSRSTGGVPKHSVDAADVGFGGIAGDKQSARMHHGRPWQALCIWSTEVIEAFAAAGHPLSAGDAGENITVTGLAWAEVRPGVRLQMGEVLCEVSGYAIPCSKNAQWFTGGAFDLMHHQRGPMSRVYATVLRPGRLVAGDPAILEP